MLLTPGGWRHKSLVHEIDPRHHLDASTGEIVEYNVAGEVVGNYGAIKERAPGMRLMPSNVVVPKDQIAPWGSGWITFGDWTNNSGHPVSLFVATWYVPPPPITHSGQTVFLFNGIQNSTMIYQPVLQWGVSAAGGGPHWSVASWYADGAGGVAHHSPLTPVHPGQKLVGVMALMNHVGNHFSYQCQFVGIPQSILTIHNVQQLTWLAITLEAYGITKKTDYPNAVDTPFQGIVVQTTDRRPPHPKWQAVDSVTSFGQHTLVVSDDYGDGIVIIFYV